MSQPSLLDRGAACCAVVVHFRSAGNAPILRQPKFKVSAQHQFSNLLTSLRKQLQLKDTDALVP